jgi:diguanylate cyclase (GGDEF)-like protein
MFTQPADAAFSLDVSTLFIVATCVSALLGLLLLFAWTQDRIRALAWWGAAYLIGGFSVALWIVDAGNGIIPASVPTALLFVACGMVWSAARLFHGRTVLWPAMLAGAAIWLVASAVPGLIETATARLMLSSVVMSVYTFLTAVELWRERRKSLIQRWPAMFVPLMHGMVFLFPIPLAGLLPERGGVVSLATGWGAVFALETMIYVIGMAFIVLLLAKERVVRLHQTAAATDPLTGLLNRRALLDGARLMIAQLARRNKPITVAMFDLDRFKSINDRFGHAVGDAAIKQFAETVVANMRATDLVGRFGGEEFVAILPGTGAEDALLVAERMRMAFEAASMEIAGRQVNGTVSVGLATGGPGVDFEALISRADKALYRAKQSGRNRVEAAPETPAEAEAPEVVPAPNSGQLATAARRAPTQEALGDKAGVAVAA